MTARGISMLEKAFDQEFLCDHARLGKAVHAAANFQVDLAVVDLVHQVVLVDDLLWYDVNGQEHIFVAFHGGAQVEVFDIDNHEFGIRGGEHTVEEDLGCRYVSNFCADVAREIDEIAADSEAGTFHFRFVRFEIDNDAAVSGFAVGWHGIVMDEEYGVGALVLVTNSLC